MAFEFNDLKGFLFLVLCLMPLTSTTNIDCNGKPFFCLNSTHFMICVDLGGGVSTTIDDFIIPCPSTTVCHVNNRFECEFPEVEEPAPLLQVIGVSIANDTSVSPQINETFSTTVPPDNITTKKEDNSTILPIPEEVVSTSNIEILEKIKEEFTQENKTFFDVNTKILTENNSSDNLNKSTVQEMKTTTENTIFVTDNPKLFNNAVINNEQPFKVSDNYTTSEYTAGGSLLDVTATTLVPNINTDRNFELDKPPDNVFPRNASEVSVFEIENTYNTSPIPTTNYLEAETTIDSQTKMITDTTTLAENTELFVTTTQPVIEENNFSSHTLQISVDETSKTVTPTEDSIALISTIFDSLEPERSNRGVNDSFLPEKPEEGIKADNTEPAVNYVTEVYASIESTTKALVNDIRNSSQSNQTNIQFKQKHPIINTNVTTSTTEFINAVELEMNISSNMNNNANNVVKSGLDKNDHDFSVADIRNLTLIEKGSELSSTDSEYEYIPTVAPVKLSEPDSRTLLQSHDATINLDLEKLNENTATDMNNFVNTPNNIESTTFRYGTKITIEDTNDLALPKNSDVKPNNEGFVLNNVELNVSASVDHSDYSINFTSNISLGDVHTTLNETKSEILYSTILQDSNYYSASDSISTTMLAIIIEPKIAVFNESTAILPDDGQFNISNSGINEGAFNLSSNVLSEKYLNITERKINNTSLFDLEKSKDVMGIQVGKTVNQSEDYHKDMTFGITEVNNKQPTTTVTNTGNNYDISATESPGTNIDIDNIQTTTPVPPDAKDLFNLLKTDNTGVRDDKEAIVTSNDLNTDSFNGGVSETTTVKSVDSSKYKENNFTAPIYAKTADFGTKLNATFDKNTLESINTTFQDSNNDIIEPEFAGAITNSTNTQKVPVATENSTNSVVDIEPVTTKGPIIETNKESEIKRDIIKNNITNGNIITERLANTERSVVDKTRIVNVPNPSVINTVETNTVAIEQSFIQSVTEPAISNDETESISLSTNTTGPRELKAGISGATSVSDIKIATSTATGTIYINVTGNRPVMTETETHASNKIKIDHTKNIILNNTIADNLTTTESSAVAYTIEEKALSPPIISTVETTTVTVEPTIVQTVTDQATIKSEIESTTMPTGPEELKAVGISDASSVSDIKTTSPTTTGENFLNVYEGGKMIVPSFNISDQNPMGLEYVTSGFTIDTQSFVTFTKQNETKSDASSNGDILVMQNGGNKTAIIAGQFENLSNTKNTYILSALPLETNYVATESVNQDIFITTTTKPLIDSTIAIKTVTTYKNPTNAAIYDNKDGIVNTYRTLEKKNNSTLSENYTNVEVPTKKQFSPLQQTTPLTLIQPPVTRELIQTQNTYGDTTLPLSIITETTTEQNTNIYFETVNKVVYNLTKHIKMSSPESSTATYNNEYNSTKATAKIVPVTEPTSLVETIKENDHIIEKSHGELILSNIVITNVNANILNRTQPQHEASKAAPNKIQKLTSGITDKFSNREDINLKTVNNTMVSPTNNIDLSEKEYESEDFEPEEKERFPTLETTTAFHGVVSPVERKIKDAIDGKSEKSTINIKSSFSNAPVDPNNASFSQPSSNFSVSSKTTTEGYESKHVYNSVDKEQTNNSDKYVYGVRTTKTEMSNAYLTEHENNFTVILNQTKMETTTGREFSTNFENENNAPSVDCSIHPRGKYADSTDCRKFYICVGKLKPVVGTCPNDTVFSEINKQCTKNLSHCVRNNQFHCLYEGRFSDFFRDNVYYICVKNNLHGFLRYKLQCQTGYHLNKANVKCEKNIDVPDLSASSVSENSKISNDENVMKSKDIDKNSNNDFECKKEGKFPYYKDCSKYYICTKTGKGEFRRKIKQCSSDEVYDKENKKCVYVESNEC